MPPRTSFVYLAVVLVAAVSLAASPSGEITLTTASDEARQLYLQAQDKADNLEYPAAAKLVEQAIAKDPSFAMAHLLKGQSSGGFTQFRESLEKAVSLADKVSPGERHWIMAAKAQAEGNTAETKEHLAELEKLFPGDKRVQVRLGRFERGVMSDERKAAVHFRKATQIDPAFAAAYNDLGYAQSAVGDYDAAEASFQKYISLLPDRPNPYDSYAELLMKTGRFDESIAQYRKALEKDPTFVASLAGIGTNQVFKKEFAAARETFEQQRAKSPDVNAQLAAMENIANSYVHEGKPAEAVRVLEEVSTRAASAGQTPLAVNAQLDAAFILSEGGKAAEADAHIQRASKLLEQGSLPESVKARLETATTLGRAGVLAAQGQFDAATGEIAKARPAIDRRQNPAEHRFLNDIQGSVALRQKRYAEALAFFEKGNTRNPWTVHQRALAAEGLGQTGQAAELFAQVADWNVNDLGYAVVRGEAIEKKEAAAVATSGKKLP